MGMRRKYHRVEFTAAQSAELWERWKKGEGLHAIGRVLGKPCIIFTQFRLRRKTAKRCYCHRIICRESSRPCS